MSEKTKIVHMERVPSTYVDARPEFRGNVGEDMGIFAVGDKVVIILESEYERLKRRDYVTTSWRADPFDV